MRKHYSSIASRALMAGILVLVAAASVNTTGRAWSSNKTPGDTQSKLLSSPNPIEQDGSEPPVDPPAQEAANVTRRVFLPGVVSGNASAPTSGNPKPVGIDGSWKIVFQDEFNGSALDKGKWHTCFWWQNSTCSIESNRELQLYNPSDVYVQNGNLVLRAQKRSMTAWNGSTYNYTSGLVMTGGSSNGVKPGFTFKYGYVEARVKIPKGKGLWPALWMLPASYTTRPEIDIMEIIGDKITDYNMNYHYNGGDDGSYWRGSDFSAGYHVMGLDWQPGILIWYVDGVERYRITWNVADCYEYVLLNMAVGGNWPGSPDSYTVFPAYMNVDYVRIWQH